MLLIVDKLFYIVFFVKPSAKDSSCSQILLIKSEATLTYKVPFCLLARMYTQKILIHFTTPQQFAMCIIIPKFIGPCTTVLVDAAHPQHNSIAAYGWIKRGEARELKTNSGQQRINLHGAINAETHRITIVESDTVDSYSTINILSAIEDKYPAALCIKNIDMHADKISNFMNAGFHLT